MRRIPFGASMALLTLAPLAARADAAPGLVDRGRYLTRAADCAGCHTAPGGTPFAGGRAFKLPFGVLYAPNITPDRATGIGAYTDAQWVRMLHEGVSRGGKHLYPVMPYPSYTRMTREDALAIKAYLFSRPAVHVSIPANRMRFPFDQRWLMVFWNLFNNPDARFKPDPAKSTDVNRGAYLVGALGHCAECHTPRNFMMGLSSSDAFAGAKQQGWLAYNLTSDRTAGIGTWSDAQLAQYLSTGHADGRGPASGPMAETVEFSLRYLTPADTHAMIAYLRDIGARPGGPPAARSDATPRPLDALGARVFVEACAGCHLPDGAGRQSAWAALRGDHRTGDVDGTNLVQVLAHGTQIETSQGLMFMHRFTRAYTDQELAAVANYVIAQFGGRNGRVTPQQIKAARGASGEQKGRPAF